MISGNIYNLNDPFSPEAADWYKAHKHQLPLDSINIADIEESSSELDSLVDDTFASLGLEDDAFLEPERPVDSSEIEHIRGLITQKKIFTANKLLSDLPESANFPDREELQRNIGKIFRKTDQLFKLAEQLEDLGKPDEAIEVVNNLLAIAADAPGIEALRTRIQQSYQVAQSLGGAQKKKEEGSEHRPENTPKVAPSLPQPITKPSFNIHSLPYKPLLAITLILGFVIGALSLYFKDQNVLSQSQAHLLKGQLLIDKKQFDGALETLEAAKTTLAELTILRFRKKSLEQAINTLLASADLREG
jgi:tetratricopeptide (TPR) repeat protein